jgi:HEPN domain-containing protein
MKTEGHPGDSQGWLARAYGNLRLAQGAASIDGIFLEDLCFNAQQAAEKALKAVCVDYQLEFPKTHSLVRLIDILDQAGINIPQEIQAADILTQYAVRPRYPGAIETITQEEYLDAVGLAHAVISWAEAVISARRKS